MLNFLVLGYIPGTHIQLTFNLLLFLAVFVGGPFMARYVVNFIRVEHRTRQLMIELISL